MNSNMYNWCALKSNETKRLIFFLPNYLSLATLPLENGKNKYFLFLFYFVLALDSCNIKHMKIILKISVTVKNDGKTEVILTTAVLSLELNSTSVVTEDTFTTTGISSELSSTNPSEISSSIPPLKSFTSFDKATTSNSGI